MAGVPPIPGLISHTNKVKSLYKRALRTLECWYDRRYHAVLMRKQFDDNSSIKDMRIAKELIVKGEKELFDKAHWHPRKFPDSPGGVAYAREVLPPDWVLDYWHPIEKAQYPDYFARREQRKIEFMQAWQKKYGKTTAPHH